jgi:hypothetical protein
VRPAAGTVGPRLGLDLGYIQSGLLAIPAQMGW